MSRRIKNKRKKSSTNVIEASQLIININEFATESFSAYSKDELLNKKSKTLGASTVANGGIGITIKMVMGICVLIILLIGGVFEGDLQDYLPSRDATSNDVEDNQIPDLNGLSCQEIIEIIEERAANRGGNPGDGNFDPSQFEGERGNRGGGQDLDPEVQECLDDYFAGQQP